MKTKKKVPSHVIKIMEKHLSKKGISVPNKRIADAILEIIARNENEIVRIMKTKKDQDTKLKKWLDTPIETEKTDSLREHDSVV